MSRIEREQVARMAELARLELPADDAERMTAELETILAYAELLEDVDTAGVEPTSHAIPLATPLRDDAPEPALDPELALLGAPERDGSAFVVPKILAEDEA